MLSINGTTIALTRGDTAYLTVPITRVDGSGETEYLIQPDDQLRLTVKRTYYDPPAMQLTLTGQNCFRIDPSDTATLDFGAYVYDVELTMSNGDVYTVIPDAVFVVGKEVS